MRLALLTLAASVAALSTAYAQDAAAPAPMPAAPADAAAPAMPAAPAAPAEGGTLAAPPGTQAADIAAPPPQELAPMPTDPLSLTIIDTLEKVCKPIASGLGGALPDLAKANGYTLRRRMWTRIVAEGGTQIVLQPTSVANPTTCVMLINHPKGGFQNLVNGMHAWASRQDPIMQLRATYVYDDQVTGMKRTTVGWEAPSVTSTTGMTGMAFTGLQRLNGREIVKGLDQTELMYQIRK